MVAGHNKIMTAYKIDTGRNGNIMPFHVYKKLFPKITKEQLAETRNKRITLKTYNKTNITQLGTCKVTTEYKINTKRYFFVVPDNGQGIIRDARYRCTSDT